MNTRKIHVAIVGGGIGGLTTALALRQAGPVAIELRRWKDNHVLLRYPLGDTCEQTFGASYYTIHRWDLLNVLLAAIPDNIIHLGWRCLTVKPYADGVDLTFSNGSSITADAVIGADGIHSICEMHSSQTKSTSLV